MDKKRSGKSKKKVKDLFAKLDSQFKNAVKERKPKTEQPKPTPAQSISSHVVSPPPVVASTIEKEKENKIVPKEPIKENKEQPKKETKDQTKRQVNFRGRVGEFHRDALYRTIPAALQRIAYKDTDHHSATDTIIRIVSSGNVADDISKVIESKFTAKPIGLNRKKMQRKQTVHKDHPLFSTARRDWLNAKERKCLCIDETGLQYADYVPLNALWIDYYRTIEGTLSEKKDAIRVMGKEGCLLSVVRSSMPQDVGIEGIVLLETRNQFVLVTKKDRVRRVNKRGHQFQLLGVDDAILLNGDSLSGQTDFEIRK